jgi:hypothetical protein
MGISSALGSQALLPAGLGFRNKLINGDMRINQRGAGTLTGSGSTQFVVDSWRVWNGTGTVTFQQSTTAPVGFSNSLLATVTSTGSYSTGGYTQLQTKIEGSNCTDLNWGTANAKPIMLSFWVRASVAGTYSCAIRNSATNRSYVATFVVTASNTWEYETVRIPGDTSGTWLTTTGVGIDLVFNLGLGTSYETASPNTWLSGDFGATSSCVDLAANTGATFAITGVQVEQNYQQTPFENRPIGTELMLCQRYYEKSFDYSTAPQNGIYSSSYISNVPYIDYWVLAMQWIGFRVDKCRVPDMSFFGDGGKWQANNSNNTWTTFAQAPTAAVQGVMGVRTSGFGLGIHNNGANGLNVVGYSRMVRGDWVASAEL